MSSAGDNRAHFISCKSVLAPLSRILGGIAVAAGLTGCGSLGSSIGLVGVDSSLDQHFDRLCRTVNPAGGVYEDHVDGGLYKVSVDLAGPNGGHDYAQVLGVIENGRISFSGTYQSMPDILVDRDSVLGGRLNGQPTVVGSGPVNLHTFGDLEKRVYMVGNKAIGDVVRDWPAGGNFICRQGIFEGGPGAPGNISRFNTAHGFGLD
jgi:hypothetical protein